MPESSIYFRDRIATSDDKGRRKWVFARLPKGRLTIRRHWVALILLTVFFTLPLIKFDGQPFVLLDVINRHFILFGNVFWPQDTYLLGIAMLTFVVFVVLFTVVFGRLWCGWACPQTILLEIIFRRVESWIEGSAAHQQALKHKSKTLGWYTRRIVKIVVFAAIIFLFVNFFLSYFIGFEDLKTAWKTGFVDYQRTLVALIALTLAGTFVYTWFREQACTIVCPYGRLQGALTDNDTLMVAYDYKRGEPRGKTHDLTNQGDCIDCRSCVQVCPTGIDIRNGTQLECVNCTACIDACDSVMTRIKKPRGLIRYASEKGILTGAPLKFTGRMVFYSIVLGGLLLFLAFLIAQRAEVETTVLRTPGILFQRNEDGTLSNLYNYKIVNKSRRDIQLTFQLVSPQGKIRLIGSQPFVKKGAAAEGVFFVDIDSTLVTSHELKTEISISEGEILVETVKTTFIGPIKP
ncbi:MAG: cytochrome c oxidase accessory protein CcoG [Bacteroidales bacterium]|nr:cytochrome c oxidase accessory protein CcoG [Bacteroidales bacterium]MDD3664192.1 cytochrome c oxidase accessory protein CcoG [Bacteroidales bacterium]